MEEEREARKKEATEFISSTVKTAFKDIKTQLKKRLDVEIKEEGYSSKITITPKGAKPFSYRIVAIQYLPNPKFPKYPSGRVLIYADKKVQNVETSDIPVRSDNNYTASEISSDEIVRHFKNLLTHQLMVHGLI
jgi:hypothetical protein